MTGPIVRPGSTAVNVVTGATEQEWPGLSDEFSGTAANLSGAGVFNVKDPAYGAAGDGTTNDAPAIRLAYAAAVAAGGGVVYFPPGTYYVNSAAGATATCVSILRGHTGWVFLRGAGKHLTTIKLGAGCTSFSNVAYSGSGDYQYCSITDMTFDGNSTTPVWGNHSIVFNHGDANADLHDFTFERIDVINAGEANNGPWRIGIGMTLYSGVKGAISNFSARKIYNITIRDIEMGRVGGGGNYLVQIQGFVSSTDASWNEMRVRQEYFTDIYIDNILIEDWTHYCGTGVLSGFYACSNIIVGSYAHGGRIIVRRGRGFWSRDDGVEINSMLDVTVEDVKFYGCRNAGVYFANLGGMPTPDQQVMRANRISAENSSSPLGWNSVWGVPLGHIKADDIWAYGAGAVGGHGNFKSFSGKKIGIRYDWTPVAGNNYCSVVYINNHGGRAVIDLDDVSMDVSILAAGAGTCYVNVFQADSCSGTTLNLAKLTQRITTAASGVTIRAGKVQLNKGDRAAHSEPFATGSYALNWYWANGASTDIGPTSNRLTPVTNTSTEQRMVAVSVGNDYYWNDLGPVDDGCWSQAVTPGATISGFKGGVIYWVATNRYLDCYVTDDGTNSFLCLDSMVDGTRSSLLGSIVGGGAGTVTSISSPAAHQADRGILLASRIANGTAYTPRLIVRGSTVKADYWAAATSVTPGSTGSTVSFTTTLTGVPLQLYGIPGQGWGGLSFVPKGTDAYIDDWKYSRMYVFRGTFRQFTVAFIAWLDWFRAIQFGQDSSLTRIGGLLSVRDCDFAVAIPGSTSGADVQGGDATLYAAMTFAAHAWYSGPPAGATVVGNVVEAVNVVAASSTAQTIPAPYLYSMNRVTLTGNCTFTLPAAVQGASFSVRLTQDGTGSRTAAFTGAKWAAGTAPTLSTGAGKSDDLVFTSYDGSTWAGYVAGLDVR